MVREERMRMRLQEGWRERFKLSCLHAKNELAVVVGGRRGAEEERKHKQSERQHRHNRESLRMGIG